MITNAKYLRAKCGVRYWEDASVNGIEDKDGRFIPLRVGDCWCPTIDLQTGIIENWPQGITADIHYKVCDAGVYTLLDNERNTIFSIEGYVPRIMYPAGDGYGDYVIMKIGINGLIEDWRADLSFTTSRMG